MSQYDNTNRGTLSRNNRKQKPTQPDHTGSINVEGMDYWVSAWVKEGTHGKFFSLALTKKEERTTQTQAQNFSDFDKDPPL